MLVARSGMLATFGGISVDQMQKMNNHDVFLSSIVASTLKTSYKSL